MAIKSTKKLKVQIGPIRKPSGEWARSKKENAILFADHLKNTFCLHETDGEK